MKTSSNQPRIPGIQEPKWTQAEKDKFRRKWASDGEDLARKQKITQWQLGDWLIVGNLRLLSLAYTEAEKITGLARPTLLDIKGTADRFDGTTPSRRRDDRLSWSHHKELKSIKDDDAMQDKKEQAIKHGWSVQKLRDAIGVQNKKDKPTNPQKTLVVSLCLADYNRLERCAAEEKTNLTILAARVLSEYVSLSAGNANTVRPKEPKKQFAETEELVAS